MGVLKYLCSKWHLPHSCLEATWKSPMGSNCDATLVLRQLKVKPPRAHVACEVCHFTIDETCMWMQEFRKNVNRLCVMCEPQFLCNVCRIALPPHVEMKTDDGIPISCLHRDNVPGGASMSLPVCIRCIGEEQLEQAAPSQMWLHMLRRRCLGLEGNFRRRALQMGSRLALEKRSRWHHACSG